MKKKTKKNPDDGTFIELDGKISILEKKAGKTTREDISGIALESLVLLIEQAIDAEWVNTLPKKNK